MNLTSRTHGTAAVATGCRRVARLGLPIKGRGEQTTVKGYPVALTAPVPCRAFLRLAEPNTENTGKEKTA